MRGKRKDKRSLKADEEALFNEPAPQAEPRRITPVDIQQKEFRLAMRGYHERDVDEFLDEITEEVARLYAENKRLSEELESKGPRVGGMALGGEADATVQQARDEAARIVADAESRARALATAPRRGGAGPPAVTGAALAGFLTREKSFLQNLAKMMQDHANAMKEDVRRVRDSAMGPKSAQSPPPGGAPAREGDVSNPDPSSFAAGVERAEPPDDPWRPPRADSSASSSSPFARPEPGSPARGPSEVVEPSEPGPPPYFMNEPPSWGEDAASRPGLPDDGSERFVTDRPDPPEPPERAPAATDLLDAEPAEGESRRPETPSYEDEPTREWTLGEHGPGPDVDEFPARGGGAPDAAPPFDQPAADEPPGSDTVGPEASDPMYAAVDQSFGPTQDGVDRRDRADLRQRSDTPGPPRRDPLLEDETSGDERSLKELFWGED